MPHHGLHILDLPVDILSLILWPLLAAPREEAISLCPCAASPINPLPILLTHPSMYAIACPLFYGVANRFLLDMTGQHRGHVRRCLKEAAEERAEMEKKGGRQQQHLQRHSGQRLPLLLLLEGTRRRIQRLEMRIDRLRGWVWDELGPVLEDMALRGGVTDFCLAVCYDMGASVVREPDAAAGMCIFGRPPMAGLLGMLADPDLRAARLRVTAVHGKVWCAYHDGEGGCGSSCVNGVGGDGDGDDDDDGDGYGDEGMVEVDWRAILREIDPQGRGRAVAWTMEDR